MIIDPAEWSRINTQLIKAEGALEGLTDTFDNGMDADPSTHVALSKELIAKVATLELSVQVLKMLIKDFNKRELGVTP
tara:strand:- start:1533 stop:1766 length:234 start_codon:yes stop_codon:yes gene_type:complete